MIDEFTYNIEVTADIATKIRILAESGFFATRGGSCDVHFDGEGKISQIVTHTHKRYPQVDLQHSDNERTMKM